MTLRKKMRALMASPRLTVLPGAYDALSARIIARAGFDAILAGGYAANGAMLAQADMGQSNMRDYADHYARICAAVEIPVFVDGDTGFGAAERAPDGARFERRRRRDLHRRPDVSPSLQLSPRQADGAGGRDDRQDQGGARRTS